MRGADVIFSTTRSWAAHIAVLASATALPACAVDDEGSVGESSTNAQLTVAAPRPRATPLFNINGQWTDFGRTKPNISERNGMIAVDMPPTERPGASGFVIDSSTIFVTFPDAGSFTGRLQAPDLIKWSNSGTWEKVFTGTMAMNLNRIFSDDRGRFWAVSVSFDGLIEITTPGRPTAHGSTIGRTKIEVTFPDDANFVGTLNAVGGIIDWSNSTQWHLAF